MNIPPYGINDPQIPTGEESHKVNFEPIINFDEYAILFGCTPCKDRAIRAMEAERDGIQHFWDAVFDYTDWMTLQVEIHVTNVAATAVTYGFCLEKENAGNDHIGGFINNYMSCFAMDWDGTQWFDGKSYLWKDQQIDQTVTDAHTPDINKIT